MKLPDPAPPSHDPLEARFEAVRPAPLPAALLRLLQQARPDLSGESPVLPRLTRFPAWGFLTAAAAVVTAGVWFSWQAPAPAPLEPTGGQDLAVIPLQAGSGETMDFYPAQESRQHLLSVRDLGVVRDSQERAVRLMRTIWLDENTYGDPGEKPALQESRFRHEIVPVLLPTY